MAVAVLFNLTEFLTKPDPKPTTGFRVQIASNACSCELDEYPYVHLETDGNVTIGPRAAIHVSETGDMTVGPLTVNLGRAVSMLSETYSTRSERILYVSADDDVPFQAIADVLDRVRRLKYPPSIPGTTGEQMLNVRVKLLTRRAVNSPCPGTCFNWVKEPLVVH